jgi:hypothetical protein
MNKPSPDYYRVLHVQPEAPREVIRASYRALMQRCHPDRGGEHQEAAIINEAYEVLSDPDKRQHYDRLLKQQQHPKRDRMSLTVGRRAAPSVLDWRNDRRCPLCRHPLPGVLTHSASCSRCDAPLSLPPASQGKKELVGRRTTPRHARDHALQILPNWQAAPVPARARNVSLTGMRLVVSVPVAAHEVIRIIDPHFDAVAVIMACRHYGDHYSLHAHFLTLRPTRRAGAFVSARA